ncbi:MAG TPA: hypothetical protein PKM73_09680 [Verrucomicrobiota bacterium]|nr:hypothetical protein [Verrucomicrobiota bacterium]HNU51790.1 hypothetical protein [Verrucomicrobiota bacterium]
MNPSRRQFLRTAGCAAGALCLPLGPAQALAADATNPPLHASTLPVGNAPVPVDIPHFPSRLHALVWRNWDLVPIRRVARVVGAPDSELRRMGRAMGLKGPRRIPPHVQARSTITVIRRNWHLLPYDQLLQLLEWSPEQLAYALREDDFLYIKLGNHKPQCAPVRYAPVNDRTRAREREIARITRESTTAKPAAPQDPLFGFVERLSATLPPAAARHLSPRLKPRFCFSYFALYGDSLLPGAADPYPDGLLARLADSGVDGVWLQAVLYRLAPFPWDPALSDRYQERLRELGRLVARARRHGIGIWLYLNEPRAMPLAFHAAHPGLKGVTEGDHATLCTSIPAVRDYLRNAIAGICQAVPDLAGFFTITASENLTHCWSHHAGNHCPRCSQRPAADVIAEANACVHAGITAAQSRARLIAWDWGWPDDAAPDVIRQLPHGVAFMSVSEWSLPLDRGGVATSVGEYSISAIGPGPRARKHWALARHRGLETLAKIQAGNTWELSAVPYIPAVENVARHTANLLGERINGLMLGWTLGGYPSPNLEVVAAVASSPDPAATDAVPKALLDVATRRFGPVAAPAVVDAWRGFSAAFSEFPYHGGLVYNAPMQYGPSNLLWEKPTGYRATMVGFPYDDLDGWRQVYPPEVFIRQFLKVADGFDHALAALRSTLRALARQPSPAHRAALNLEMGVAEAAALHFRSTANQARFVLARQTLAAAITTAQAEPALQTLKQILESEAAIAARLHTLQLGDSRLGFEASNQYFFVPADLIEKVLNCRDLLARWLPAQARRFGSSA